MKFILALILATSVAYAEEIGIAGHGQRDTITFEMLTEWEGLITYSNSPKQNSASYAGRYTVAPGVECSVNLIAGPGPERLLVNCGGYWEASPSEVSVKDGEEVTISLLSRAF